MSRIVNFRNFVALGFTFWFAGCPSAADLAGTSAPKLNPQSTGTLVLPPAKMKGLNGDNGSVDRGSNPNGDTGFLVPPPRYLNCSQSQSAVLNGGQSVSLNFASSNPSQTPTGNLDFDVRTSGTLPAGTDLGGVVQSGDAEALYTAPAHVATSFDVQIFSKESSDLNYSQTPCTVRLLQDGDIGVIDDGHSEGLVGNVYQLPVGTNHLPDFTLLTPVTVLLTPNVNVADHDWSEGFPGAPAAFVEWFGIDFKGRIYIPATGDYRFRVDSDDGAILYIDGIEVVNDDGLHAVSTVISDTISLTKGLHDFHERYYQGPRTRIANMVYWHSMNDPDTQSWVIIPPDALYRPAP